MTTTIRDIEKLQLLDPFTVRHTIWSAIVKRVSDYAPTNLMTTATGHILCPQCMFLRKDSPQFFEHAEKYNYEAFDGPNPQMFVPKSRSIVSRTEATATSFSTEMESYDYSSSSGSSTDYEVVKDTNPDDTIMTMFRGFAKESQGKTWPDHLYQDLQGCGQKKEGAGVAYFRNPPHVLACVNSGVFMVDEWLKRDKPCGFKFAPYVQVQFPDPSNQMSLNNAQHMLKMAEMIGVEITGVRKAMQWVWPCFKCVVHLPSIRDKNVSNAWQRKYANGTPNYLLTQEFPWPVNHPHLPENEFRVWVNAFDTNYVPKEYGNWTNEQRENFVPSIRCTNAHAGPESKPNRACNYEFGRPVGWKVDILGFGGIEQGPLNGPLWDTGMSDVLFAPDDDLPIFPYSAHEGQDAMTLQAVGEELGMRPDGYFWIPKDNLN